MSYQEAYPWPDEGHSTEREYLRNWKGMPLRSEWNSSPSLKHCQTCTSCGYKWDQVDFTYRGAMLNGEAPAVAVHRICWNCFQCETNHEQTRKFWEAVDKPQTGSTAKKTPQLKTMGSLS
jgi:hypothetical protein